MFQIARPMAGVIERPDTDVLVLLLRFVVARDVALVVGINDVPVARIGHDKAAFAAAGLEPIFAPDHAALAPARDPDVRVILLRAVDVIGKRVIHRDVIELRGRLIVLGRRGLVADDRNAGAAVAGVRDSFRIFRINPEPVMIAVARGEKVEGLAAIDRTEESGIQDVDRIGRARVRVDFAEIPGALPEAQAVVDPGPVVAAIFRAENPAFLRFNDGINPIGISARNAHADATKNAFGQAMSLELLPGSSTVDRTIKPAAFAAAREKPGLPADLPERREERVRIMRVEDDVDRAGVFVFAQDFRPRLSAVG